MNIVKHLKTLFFFAFLLSSGVLFSQQAPQFTQYGSTILFMNPGYSGMGQGICANGVVRQQWAGFQDADGNKVAPQDFLVSLDSPVTMVHGGIGGAILQDQLGFENNIGLMLGYSYHLDTPWGLLGMGAALNLTNRTIDFSKFKPVETNDPALLSAKQGDMLVDGNLGVFLKSNRNFFVGLSATNIFENTGKNLNTSGTALYYQTDRTYYLLVGTSLLLPNHPQFEIVPSILIQSDIASTQYNFSAVVNYKSKFWGGINYRFQESFGFMVGVTYAGFRFGYSYDLPTLPVGLAGSHEISLGYCFKIKTDKARTSYKNTRFL